jgi:hypothetical protein
VTVPVGDEGLHPAGAEISWVETTWLEFYDDASGLAGVVRLDVRPNQGASGVSLRFFLSDDGFVLADHVTSRVVGASSVVEIEDARLETVEPLRRWSVKYDGGSHSLAAAADVGKREEERKSRLERLIAELEVVAVQDAVAGSGSFAQPVRVTGEVWVSGDRYAVDAPGLRGKSWHAGSLADRATYLSLSFGAARAVFARVETPAGGTADVVEGWTSIDGTVRPLRELRVEPADTGSGAPGLSIVAGDDRGEHRIAVELPWIAPFRGRRSGGRPFELRLAVARARWGGHAGSGLVEELE